MSQALLDVIQSISIIAVALAVIITNLSIMRRR